MRTADFRGNQSFRACQYRPPATGASRRIASILTSSSNVSVILPAALFSSVRSAFLPRRQLLPSWHRERPHARRAGEWYHVRATGRDPCERELRGRDPARGGDLAEARDDG